MEGRQFDAVTRALSAGESRRRLITLVAAVPALVGLRGLIAPEQAEAKNKKTSPSPCLQETSVAWQVNQVAGQHPLMC